MDYIPNDIILQIAIRIPLQDIVNFFSSGKRYNYAEDNYFWALKANYDYGYNTNLFQLSDIETKTKFNLLKNSDIETLYKDDNTLSLFFLKESPKYLYYDFQDLFERAIKEGKTKVVSGLIEDYRIDLNICSNLIFETLKINRKDNYYDILEVILNNSRFDPAYNNYELISGLLNDIITNRDPEILFILGKNKYVHDYITDDFIVNYTFQPGLWNYEVVDDEYPYCDNVLHSFRILSNLLSYRIKNNLPLIGESNPENIEFKLFSTGIFDMIDEFKVAYKEFDIMQPEAMINIVTLGDVKIKDILIQGFILHSNANNVIKYLIQEDNTQFIKAFALKASLRVGNYEITKLIAEDIDYKKEEKDILTYFKHYNGDLLEFFWNIPEYQTIIRKYKVNLFKCIGYNTDQLKQILRITDLHIDTLDDMKFINMDVFNDIFGSNEIINICITLFEASRINIKRLSIPLLKYMIVSKSVKGIDLILNHPDFSCDCEYSYTEIHKNILTNAKILSFDVGYFGQVASLTIETLDKLKFYKHYNLTTLNQFLYRACGKYEKTHHKIINSHKIILQDPLINKIISTINPELDFFKTPSFIRYAKENPDGINEYCSKSKTSFEIFETIIESCDINGTSLCKSLIENKEVYKIELLMSYDKLKELLDINALVILCCEKGNLEILEILCEDDRVLYNDELLLYSVQSNQIDIVKYLLDNKYTNIEHMREELYEEAELRDNEGMMALFE